MTETMPILTPIRIGKKTAANRIAINAMECCDADTNGNPTSTAFRRYERLARGDAGVIVVEALSVVDENRGRLHQLTALPQNQKGLTELVATMRKANPKPIILWQLTHSGELSSPEFSERVCVKPFPGYEGRLLTDEEVDEILERFVFAAKMAHDCGADGVDFKLCHGYLGTQLLRPFNDRKWKYGGTWANRTRFAYEFYERIEKEIKDPGFIVGSKISVWEGLPGGMGSAGPDTPIMDLTEVLDLVKGLEARGAKYIIESAGNPSLTLSLVQAFKNVPGDLVPALRFPEADTVRAQARDGGYRLQQLDLQEWKEQLPRREEGGIVPPVLGKQEHQGRRVRHGGHRQAISCGAAVRPQARAGQRGRHQLVHRVR